MKPIIILFILSFTLLGYSQNKLNYIGTLFLKEKTPISFKLEIIEKDGIVNGKSITNIGTADETESKITGIYFKSDKSFQLQENEILKTKSKAPLNTFCYINMNLSFRGLFGKKHLEGSFTGKLSDNSECANGRIILIEEKKIHKRIKKIKKKIDKKYSKLSLEKNLNKEKTTLKDGETLSIKWNSKKITLYVWDTNQEDGDKIELIINNKTILHDFKTKNKPKKIKIKAKEGENIIEIKAVNIGRKPPNTSSFILIDNKNKYQIITQLKLTESAIIKIIK
tara:strand:- start:449 stop:1291 length:843 start_codon:yes stop_codon:yes gene_type:complete